MKIESNVRGNQIVIKIYRWCCLGCIMIFTCKQPAFSICRNQWTDFRSSCLELFCRKGVLRNFAKFIGKRVFHSLFFNKVAGLRPTTLLKKETLAQVFSCEFWVIYKSNYSCRTPLMAAFLISSGSTDIYLIDGNTSWQSVNNCLSYKDCTAFSIKMFLLLQKFFFILLSLEAAIA